MTVRTRLISILLLVCACSTGQKQTETAPPSPVSARPRVVFISNERIAQIKERIDKKIQPIFTAWEFMVNTCNSLEGYKPRPVVKWAIPGAYENSDLQQRLISPLQMDSIVAYELSLCFRLTGNEDFAKRATEIVSAWVSTLKTADTSMADTQLSMSELFPSMLVAADLLKTYPGWTPGLESRFKKFVKEIILPLNSMSVNSNSRANWGMLLVASIGAYLQDEELLSQVETRFKELMETQIDSDGVLIERGKDRVWDTNYALMPTALSAEILRLNGRNIFNFTSSRGAGLEKAFHAAAQSNKGKSKGLNYISYYEILNQRWSDISAKALLQKRRPMTSHNSFPNLTLTHAELSSEF